MDPRERTQWIEEQAPAIGFDLCGVTPVADFPEHELLAEWLARGYAGEMRYMHDPRRASFTQVLEGAKSIIVCAMNYNTAHPYSIVGAQHVAPLRDPAGPRGWISRYAWGDDYHDVLLPMLERLIAAMREKFSETFEARAYVDTGPILERVAAKYAGLGWLGKNTLLINEKLGSWLFLGVVITTLELEPSLCNTGTACRAPTRANLLPPPDLCGNCSLCIDACPTGAIVEPYVLDARRCISYLTIELRGPIPEEFHAPMGRMVFGCDICQDVCPWNRKAPASERAGFQPRAVEQAENRKEKSDNRSQLPEAGCSLFSPSLEWLSSLTESEFRKVFHGSPVKRTKWRGLIRNVQNALANFDGVAGKAPGA